MPRHHSPGRRHGSRSPSPHRRHHSRSPSPGHRRRSKSPPHHKHGHKHSPPHHRRGSHSSSSSSDSERRHETAAPKPDIVGTKEESDVKYVPVKKSDSTTTETTTKTETVAEVVPTQAFGMANLAESSSAAADPGTSTATQKEFKMSSQYGGNGGAAFDHHNRRRIDSITVCGGKFVDGISIKYGNGDELKNGGSGGNADTLTLAEDEYVNEVKLKEGNVVLSICFITNKGNQLGPCGSGKTGGLISKDGKAVQVKAPDGYRLVGIYGRAGTYLDAIGFRWGPVST